MSELSANPIKQSWALDDLTDKLFGWPHFGTRESEDLSWLFMHDHLALPFGELQTEDGMRTAICQIAHRYAHSKQLEETGFRKKEAAYLFRHIGQNGKSAAADLRRLTPDHIKLLLERTTAQNFSPSNSASRFSEELEALVSEFEDDLITFGSAKKPEQTDLMKFADSLHRLSRLTELAALRNDLIDKGGKSNVHRRFAAPANWELFHNVNKLFILAERHGYPHKKDRLDEFFKGIHLAVTGVEEVDFRASYTKYFQAWDAYVFCARELKTALLAYGYRSDVEITNAFDRMCANTDIIPQAGAPRTSRQMEAIAGIKNLGDQARDAKRALEKTYIPQA